MKRTEKITTFGFFNVDKPSGMTSSTVVNKIKWLTGVPCGHMGTLDPLASGVLPVGVGNATRLFNYFLDKEKEYIAEFTFGVDSDTLDSTGELIYGGQVPSEKEIESVLPAFFGDILQVPPKYSAKNVNGRRGYDLARAGVDFELPPKKVHIYGIELLGRAEDKENAFRFKIRCGGGTYIRSLARDIAAALETKAVMSALRRTQSGCFLLSEAIPFSILESDPSVAALEELIIPTERVLPIPDLLLTEKNAGRLFNGQRVATEEEDGLYKIYKDGVFYGIAEVKNGLAKAEIKLC
ncbi:MAG: tRNA pseudouridine(55) synthase TruB [Clostridiales bacterium]|nr:tRNA pseudouridine(55) synthase TruB [Clostridiales bacterium]